MGEHSLLMYRISFYSVSFRLSIPEVSGVEGICQARRVFFPCPSLYWNPHIGPRIARIWLTKRPL